MHVLSWPAVLSIEVTAACSNQCPGCSNVYADEREMMPMPARAWERLLAGFAPETVWLRLTGGEPTLHPEFFSILEAATSYDAWVTVFTNARWNEPEEFVRRLRGWPNLAGLLISLHGASPAIHETFTRTPGSFEETTTNIRRAVANDIPVVISSIITGVNWDQLDGVVDLARDLGAVHVAFNRYLGLPIPGIEPTAVEMYAAAQTIETLLQNGAPVKYGVGLPQCFVLNSSKGCLAGVAYAAVDPWGNLRPCAHSPSVIGSLHDASMDELWHSSAMNTWRSWMPQECLACEAYSSCHGGCRAMHEVRPDGCDPLRGEGLIEYVPPASVNEVPADEYPIPILRIRPEPFGYALLGQGQVVPVREEALAVLQACDGSATFAQLAKRFGQNGLGLLGELWELGMLKAA